MLNKILIIATRIIGLVLVFVAPIIHLFIKYGGSETETVEVTTNSMPVVVLLLISLLAGGLSLWLFSAIRMTYIEELRKHPFGHISILTIGAIILALAVLIRLWLNKLSDLVNFNAQQFAQDITIYSENVDTVIWYMGIGLAITLGSLIWDKATQ